MEVWAVGWHKLEMYLETSERGAVLRAGLELMRTLPKTMDDCQLAVYCMFRQYFRDEEGEAMPEQGMALVGMFYVGGEYPSAQERRVMLGLLENRYEGAKREEIARRRELGMVMPPGSDNMAVLLSVVLIKGVDMEGYESLSAAMDRAVAIMNEDPDGRVDKWETHGEWARLTLFLGESPDRAVIREANMVGFDRAMERDSQELGAVPDMEVGRLTEDERRLRRVFMAYCVYGFESRYWE